MQMQSTFGTGTQAMKTMFKGMSDEMQMCINNCSQCHLICEQMVQHCLSKGGRHAELKHIRLLQDCAQICSVSADFMTRNSDFHQVTCRACAELCNQCAADCAQINDDEMMQMCIDACKRCAESCSKMAGLQ